jgi:hypothetical protein
MKDAKILIFASFILSLPPFLIRIILSFQKQDTSIEIILILWLWTENEKRSRALKERQRKSTFGRQPFPLWKRTIPLERG